MLYILGASLLFISCFSSKNKIEISYNKIDADVFIRVNANKIVSIDYPIGINLKNITDKNVSFSSIDYWEKDIKAFKSSLLYKKENNNLIEVGKSNYKPIKTFKSNTYILYTQQKIDTSKITQQIFTKYLKKDNLEKKINIGNVTSFNKKNNVLVKKIIKGDSLNIRIRYRKKIENIKIPVKSPVANNVSYKK